jgi:hypothetical protein
MFYFGPHNRELFTLSDIVMTYDGHNFHAEDLCANDYVREKIIRSIKVR